MLEEKQEFHLYNLTKEDVSNLEIKKSHHGNCLIKDSGDKYYKGFILNQNGDTQTVCEIVFYPSAKSGLYIPRPTFYKSTVSKSEIKNARKPEKVIISFAGSEEGLHEFWKMIGFLLKFKNLVDVGEFEKSYKIVGIDDIVLRLKDLDEPERVKEVIEYAIKSNISPTILAHSALLSERKTALDIFEKLLNEDGYITTYKKEKKISKAGEEPAWHYFLKNNQWLLGLNLDIRFIGDFADETSIGNPNTENKGNPKIDLMGLRDYTVLVELKTPNTKFFTKIKTSDARSETWSFTPEFIEGFSQCLAQKFEWDKTSESKDLVKNGEVLDKNEYRTIDPKTIYIVGNKKKEIPRNSKVASILTQRDTFERFRRNNRNIEIITYDELYERANFVVNGVV